MLDEIDCGKNDVGRSDAFFTTARHTGKVKGTQAKRIAWKRPCQVSWKPCHYSQLQTPGNLNSSTQDLRCCSVHPDKSSLLVLNFGITGIWLLLRYYSSRVEVCLGCGQHLQEASRRPSPPLPQTPRFALLCFSFEDFTH